jgi:hypothetical protein
MDKRRRIGDPQWVRLTCLVRRVEAARLKAAARRLGVSLQEFLRHAALDALKALTEAED